jgi:hypothetical protein
MPITCDTGLAQELSTVLQIASLDMAPAVTSAAHILAAEMLTTKAEACQTCPGLPDLCSECRLLTRDAVIHRELAMQLAAPAGWDGL